MKVLLLNSAGFSALGWVTRAATQRVLADLLADADLDVSIAEVATTAEVDAVLGGISADTLVWPNAYYVRAGVGSDRTDWLADVLEARDVPFVGSPAAALEAMLHKDTCQARLAAAGIPVPRFAAVSERDPAAVRGAFEAADLSWPVVVKPTSTANSLGIARVRDFEGLIAQVGHIFDCYGPRAIIEEYLPGNDLTVGVLTYGIGTVLLPTWYEFDGRGCDVLDHEARQVPWGGPKRMRVVTEPEALEQVETVVPRVVRALGIRDATRIDGRIDEHGVLRVFDVNGMPGLEDPNSVMLHQVKTVWETDSQTTLARLFGTMAASAAERYGLAAPAAVLAHAACVFSYRAPNHPARSAA